MLLLSEEAAFYRNSKLKSTLKKLFDLKCNGSEEDYIIALQRAGELKQLLESILLKYIG